MAEICEICLNQLKLWDDYVFIAPDAEVILCKKCQEEVDKLYDEYDCNKGFKKCFEQIRKRRKNGRSN